MLLFYVFVHTECVREKYLNAKSAFFYSIGCFLQSNLFWAILNFSMGIFKMNLSAELRWMSCTKIRNQSLVNSLISTACATHLIQIEVWISSGSVERCVRVSVFYAKWKSAERITVLILILCTKVLARFHINATSLLIEQIGFCSLWIQSVFVRWITYWV